MKNLPLIIKEVGFDFHWDNRKVWALDITVEEMDIKDLEWHFKIPFWNKPGGFYDLTPNEVLESPSEYEEEYKRIIDADIKYPLDIMFWKNRWLLLDGLHRLVKAKKLGRKKIKVRRIPFSYIPKFIK